MGRKKRKKWNDRDVQRNINKQIKRAEEIIDAERKRKKPIVAQVIPERVPAYGGEYEED